MLRYTLVIVAMLLQVVFRSVLPAMAEGKRVALVIGNAAYSDVGTLANPEADAKAVAAALQAAGFDEVRHFANLSAESMRQELKAFSSLTTTADVAVIYYAGHGVEVTDQNYLVPVDAKLLRSTDIDFEAISLAAVRQAVSGAAKLRIVVLDACRNNPFKLEGKGGTRAATRGLGRIEPSAGEVVAYAAKEGTLAQDGPANLNSPFAAALVNSLREPGLEIRLLFGKVRDDVLTATGNEQEPYTYASLGGDAVYLTPPVATLGSSAAEEWKLVSGSLRADLLQAFRRKYASDDVYRLLAEERLALLESSPQQKPLPKSFRDCETCPELVVVPAGEFLMGSPEDEPQRDVDEGPQHEVSINRAIAVGKFEVTRDQFNTFLQDTGHDMGNKCTLWTGTSFVGKTGFGVLKPGFGQTGDHPATCISWQDAKAYVIWLSGRTGNTYRLLTEAEWEYAARAGQSAAYQSGATLDPGRANFKNTSTVPVGLYAANAFGLHDVHGNVWEWTEDCHSNNYESAPADGSAVQRKPDCERTYRGGGWFNTLKDMRFSTRGVGGANTRVNIFGLRVARDMK
jgi:formylglycine-generating enzyme required for sulfatase activity